MANYTLIGRPGSGKSYFATHQLVKKLKARYENKKDAQFPLSNYPVKHNKYGACYRFMPEMIYFPLQDAYIVTDEGYQYFGQSCKKDYKLDYEVFFGTVRHNNVDNLVIAHGMTRINADIRDKTEIYYVVKKIGLPEVLFPRPFWFRIYGYEDLGFVDNKTIDPFLSFNVLFRKSIADCYNTHFWRKPDFDMSTLPVWDEDSLIEVDENISKGEEININKNNGVLSDKKVNKMLSNDEVVKWDNTVEELDTLL